MKSLRVPFWASRPEIDYSFDAVLRVSLTVDCELWPIGDRSVTQAAVARHYRGETPSGQFGLEYQARMFADAGFAGTFFVESLASVSVGRDPIAECIAMLLRLGQDVQLHTHPEWLPFAVDPLLRRETNGRLADYSKDEQKEMIKLSKELFESLGAPTPVAFRAGGYCANRDTLRAIGELGMKIDSSYNYRYLHTINEGGCKIDVPDLWSPRRIEDVLELPVTCFRDGLGQVRPLQPNAASLSEQIQVLEQAERSGLGHVVLISHGGELVGRTSAGKDPLHRLVLRRLQGLVRWLAARPDRFSVVSFGAVAKEEPREVHDQPAMPRTKRRTMAYRWAEQLATRWI